MTKQDHRHAVRVAELKASAAAAPQQVQRASVRGDARTADQKFNDGMWDAVGWLSIAMDAIREKLIAAEAAPSRLAKLEH